MIKFRSCMVTQQLAHYDTDDIKVIEERVKKLNDLKSYCLIIHDKDILIDKDGNKTPKAPHFHIVLTFGNSTTDTALAPKLGLGDKIQCIEKIKTNVTNAREYLIHLNDIHKYQYNPNQVLADFDYIDFIDGKKPKPKLEEILELIYNGTIKRYNQHNYYDVHFYTKYKNRIESAYNFRKITINNMDRQLTCMYITGPSGVGKTTFAKMLSEKQGYKSYVASGGAHGMDDYNDQECIILDELRDNKFKLEDFLKLTDNNTGSAVGCRFYNKSISECKLLIITSVQPIDKFYEWDTDDIEERKQLYRRLTNLIIMDKDTITEKIYDPISDTYTTTATYNNLISTMYDKQKATALVSGLADLLGLKKLDAPEVTDQQLLEIQQHLNNDLNK